MAHKKGVGSSDNGRDSKSKRLGVKLFGGQLALAGNIIVRQRGTKFHAGENVYMGKDHTLHAKIDGIVDFQLRKNKRKYINILPLELLEDRGEGEEKIDVDIPKEVEKKEPKEVKAEVEKPEVVKKKGATSKKGDDLSKIEGIGPKIREILGNAGISTFKNLAEKSAEEVKEILQAEGSRYNRFDPTTWPKQAEMAASEKWDELTAWQEELKGGRA